MSSDYGFCFASDSSSSESEFDTSDCSQSHQFRSVEDQNDAYILHQRPTALADLRLALMYTKSDIAARPRNFCIGVFSTFLVTFVVGLILLVTAKSPVIYLRLAELSVSEADALLLADGSRGLPFVNYSDLEPRIAQSQRTAGCSPRWIVPSQLAASEFSSRKPHPDARSLEEYPKLGVTTLLIDSAKEKDIGIGRGWSLREIGWSEAQVWRGALRFTGLQPEVGMRGTMSVSLFEMLARQGIALGNISVDGLTFGPQNIEEQVIVIPDFDGSNETKVTIPGLNITITIPTIPAINGTNATIPAFNFTGLNLTIPGLDQLIPTAMDVSIAEQITGADGKYPSPLGNVAIMDYRDVTRVLLSQACLDTVSRTANTFGANVPTAQQLARDFPLDHFAFTVVAQMKESFRMETYYGNDAKRLRGLVEWTDDLFRALGVDWAGTAQYPLAIAVSGFGAFNSLLGSVFNATTAVIIGLGAILVYTLLATNADERGFEVAMLRATGMSRRQLLLLMMLEMFSFVIPGLVIAMGVLVLLNVGVEAAISSFTHAKPDYSRFGWQAAIIPPVLGLFVPLISNIGPIRSALSRSLRDALDIYRNKSNETTVTMQRLSELGLEPWQVFLGAILAVFGFSIYYIVPMSFLFQQMWLFFLIFNLILLGMLVGLCMIGHALQSPLEQLFLWLMLWRTEKRLHTLIVRNFDSHRSRNSSAFMMFTLTAACFIFGGVLFTLLSKAIGQLMQVTFGSDITVSSLAIGTPIEKSSFDELLGNSSLVAGWTYSTFHLSAYKQFMGKGTIASLLGFPSRYQNVVAVEENYLDVVFPQFVKVDELDKSLSAGQAQGNPDVVRSLYMNTTQDSGLNPRPIGPVYAGFPPGAQVPAWRSKYDRLIPALVAGAAKDVLGITAGTFGTLSVNYRTGRGSTIEHTSESLMPVRGLLKKLSGFPTISSLQMALFVSEIVVSVPSFQNILLSNVGDYPSLAPNTTRYQYQSDAFTEPRYQRLYVRLVEDVSEEDREYFTNQLKAGGDPHFHATVDTWAVVKSVEKAASLSLYFFFFTSAVAAVLNTFMLWLTFVSNVQIGAWSFAVLRSLGFTVSQLRRAFIYESLAIVLSAFVVGSAIGVLVAFMLLVQLNLFLQLPLQFAFPWELFGFLCGVSLLSAVVAPCIPVHLLAKRPIAHVIKSGG